MGLGKRAHTPCSASVGRWPFLLSSFPLFFSEACMFQIYSFLVVFFSALCLESSCRPLASAPLVQLDLCCQCLFTVVIAALLPSTITIKTAHFYSDPSPRYFVPIFSAVFHCCRVCVCVCVCACASVCYACRLGNAQGKGWLSVFCSLVSESETENSSALFTP